MKRFGIFCIIIASASILPIFAQETGPDYENVYYDELFNEYLELETTLLQKIDERNLQSYNLGEIESLKFKAETENRYDVISRLEMLSYVVKTALEEEYTEVNAEALMAGMTDAEKRYQEEKTAAGILPTASTISIATAFTAGAVYAASAILTSSFYSKYTATESADDAAFYMFWWQFFEDVSIAGAVTTILSGTAAGITAALY
ncbi:MAG: hypothetical protein PQJ61_01280 [Spirochaetales bacterium]|uniref:Uncharacterized protein n=1 Tax=Candidatus Thalassospirochaeta sargassi TaxID=3119039 RepID=A0AAJ1MJ09_9SPIO|nr:hypothetical protein [Spirochaetales bacterium]